MKKLISILMCLVIVLSLFTACGGNDTTGNNQNQGDSDKEVITIGIPLKTTVIDYDTNEFTLWLEEQLNVDIQIQKFATGGNDYKTQFSGLLLKGDKMPDILWNFESFSGGLWDMYGQDEYLVNLKPYMEDKEGASKIWWDRVADIDEGYVANVLKRCEDDFGDMYVLPRIETSSIDTMDYMVSVNQTWLDACGLKQPTNIDEFYNMLVTFKNKMCAGKAGYYPLVGGGPASLCGDVANWIINMYIYFNDATWFNLSEDGTTLTTPFSDPLYREALQFLNKLYKEGLLQYELDNSEMKNLINPADGVPRVGMFVGHPTLNFLSDDVSIDNFVALENYWGYTVRTEDINSLSSGITTDCENPDLAFKLLMLACSEEGSYRLRYGVKGVDWDDADEGAKSYLGVDCDIKVMSSTLSTSTQNKSWINGPGILINAENEAVQYTDEGGWISKRCNIAAGIYNAFCAAEANNPKYICPIMVLSELQSQTNETERTNTSNLIYIMRDTFIKGTSNDTVLGGSNADINNDDHWNKYVAALDKEGLKTWQGMMQEIYNNEYKDIILGG